MVLRSRYYTTKDRGKKKPYRVCCRFLLAAVLLCCGGAIAADHDRAPGEAGHGIQGAECNTCVDIIEARENPGNWLLVVLGLLALRSVRVRCVAPVKPSRGASPATGPLASVREVTPITAVRGG